MNVRAALGRIPLRVPLTTVLVLLVVAVSATDSYVSYKAARHSLEDNAVSSLQASAADLAAAAQALLANQGERLASITKAVELACGMSGRMNVLCARDTLRPFMRAEHVRGLRLHYGPRRQLTLGKFANGAPHEDSPRTLEDAAGQPFLVRAHHDAEGGLTLEADFAVSPLHTLVAADPTRVDLIANTGQATRSVLSGHSVLQESRGIERCLSGEPLWSLEGLGGGAVYRAYRPLPNGAMCAVAEVRQAVVLAPIARLRAKLAKSVTAFVAASIILAYLIAYLFTHPLQVLKRRVRELRKGDFDSPVPIVGAGEIRDFAEAFASTAEYVRSSRQALIESERQLMLAYKAARLWLWDYSESNQCLTWRDPADPAAHTRTASLHASLRLVDERDRHAVVASIRATKETGIFAIEFRAKAAGEERWIAAWGHVVDDAERPGLITGVSLDSTSRRQAQRLMAEREKLLANAEMAASLAHEINNPLTSIINAIYMASSSREVPEGVKRYLEMARENADRVARIARHMLGLYRVPARPEAVHVRHLLQDVIDQCRPKAHQKRQQFDVDLDWPGSVFGFTDELRQAMINLVENAVEHSPAASTIAIRAHRARAFDCPAQRGVRVVVANAASEPLGPMARIDPFSSSKTQRGAGLGLWVTKTVVVKHGGKLRIRTYGRDLDRVCCMVYLPMRSPELSASAS